MISESLAKTRWPDRDPIGLRIEFGNMDGDLRLLTIVGIVGDVRHAGSTSRRADVLRERAAAAAQDRDVHARRARARPIRRG